MIDEPDTVVTQADGTATFSVRVVREIDVDSAPALEEALARALRSDTRRTVVDLSETVFADSTILHVLMEARRRHEAAGRPMVVAGPLSDVVRRLFDVTGTAAFFGLGPDGGTAASAGADA
ncbi:STAS domain-containing protein [Streptomyces sp. TRM 70351]|uniref:STAS domain-containing protein n=1 Tax=Streptomyces sp. TRM 70351 TaxID=3116552 RepID=UPI002E7B7587|nr:STAS domain-containing protein [Streptomyces sp. TRM 70351]MEE1930499.1 STAS domain-containing protein [Streptomyces sp. TRM 70351]